MQKAEVGRKPSNLEPAIRSCGFVAYDKLGQRVN